jgi:PhzF family phenazine biosynthesis protein
MRLPFFHVDAFTSRIFAGNPAGVVPLEEWLPAETMQAIAAENNLSETAFFVREGDGYAIRWFTPALESDLCGHATLASAFIITQFLDRGRQHRVAFRTQQAGTLWVACDGDELALDFPAWSSSPADIPENLARALGGTPEHYLVSQRDHIVVFKGERDILQLEPDFRALAALPLVAVIATAPGTGSVDFVSRFFAPRSGIDEDPVTGSAHCALVPYWAARLGKSKLSAHQVSRRGGALSCALVGERVTIAGQARLYLEGTITL